MSSGGTPGDYYGGINDFISNDSSGDPYGNTNDIYSTNDPIGDLYGDKNDIYICKYYSDDPKGDPYKDTNDVIIRKIPTICILVMTIIRILLATRMVYIQLSS